MPEAAMYKNDGFVLGQHHIRLPRQILYMQPVPEPLRVQIPAHKHLRPGIFCLDTAHVVAACGGGVYVHGKYRILEYMNKEYMNNRMEIPVLCTKYEVKEGERQNT